MSRKGSSAAAPIFLMLLVVGSQPSLAQSGQSAAPDWPEEKQKLDDFGKQFESAEALYQALREEADNPEAPPGWESVSDIPDWGGLWEREAPPMVYDPDQPSGFEPTANLKGEYAEMMEEAVADAQEGRIFDETSVCGVPRGYPGVLRNPRPWEFAILPHQTWILTEAQNEVRRIYTDGRGHTPQEMAFPSEDGDTIGFWDEDRLITYTKLVKEGWLGRMQPYLSSELEGVEIWQKVDEETVQADVWLYDREALEEPWFTRQIYKQVEQPFPGHPLRIHFWECADPNNAVHRTEDGGSTFTDFDFYELDDDLYELDDEQPEDSQ